MIQTKNCQFCGKEFIPNNNKQKYCKGPHYRLCPVCGRQYLETNIDNLKKNPVACSYKCRSARANQSKAILPYSFNTDNDIFIKDTVLCFPEDKIMPKLYYKNKTDWYYKKGYKCIHIWNEEDEEKIIKSLKPKKDIMAYECRTFSINKKYGEEFISSYSLMPKNYSNALMFGLVYREELIQLLAIGRPQHNKHYDAEIYHICNHFDYNVIGGRFRLLNFAMKNYFLNSVIAYCDYSKSRGEEFIDMDMKFLKYNYPMPLNAHSSIYDCGKLIFEIS